MMSKQQQKATNEEFPQKRQLKAANCLHQKSKASNTQPKHLLEMVRAQQDSLQTKFQSLQSTKSKKRQQARPNSQKDGLWPWFIPPSTNVQGSNTL